jgi:predicted transcriptional regulator
MEALWARGRGTVAEIAAALKRGLAYTTVLTMLRSLERKGYVRHDVVDRAFVYVPLADRKSARQGVVESVMHAFFGGSPRELMLHLVDDVDDPRVEGRLRKLLSEAEGRR